MIDSHCHIYRKEYDEDRIHVIERAASAGVTRLLIAGCNLEESLAAIALAEAFSGIHATVGIHPHEAKALTPEDLTELVDLTHNPNVIAYGEIGLDFAYDYSPRNIQKRVFAQQMEVAQSLDKPVVIHSRNAEPETLDIVRTFPIARSGQAHCFTGSQHMADALLDLGFFLGFTGIITFKNADDLRQVVRQTPLERILIETDSPYLAPVPFRGRRNEPCRVEQVCHAIANIKKIDVDKVAQQTSLNFNALYAPCGEELTDLEVPPKAADLST